MGTLLASYTHMRHPQNIQDVLLRLIICTPSRLPTGCWEWQGATDNGYGRTRWQGKKSYAHRVVYEHFRGIVPAGLHIDHLCRNRRCANPWHLEPVSRKENILRGDGPTALNARRTHCKNGHPLTGQHLFVTSEGRRRCHPGWLESMRLWREANRPAKETE